MLTVIKHTLEHDDYVPARRASTLLLNDLLLGMNNLIDFQEHLLPIYRLLKQLADNDPDINVQIHARNGLELIKDKVKDAFNVSPKIEKKIRIRGVKSQENVITFK